MVSLFAVSKFGIFKDVLMLHRKQLIDYQLMYPSELNIVYGLGITDAAFEVPAHLPLECSDLSP